MNHAKQYGSSGPSLLSFTLYLATQTTALYRTSISDYSPFCIDLLIMANQTACGRDYPKMANAVLDGAKLKNMTHSICWGIRWRKVAMQMAAMAIQPKIESLIVMEYCTF